MRYIMTDWQGRQVGNTEDDIKPLIEMAQRLNESNDLVIWSLNDRLVRHVRVVVAGPLVLFV